MQISNKNQFPAELKKCALKLIEKELNKIAKLFVSFSSYNTDEKSQTYLNNMLQVAYIPRKYFDEYIQKDDYKYIVDLYSHK